MSYSFEIINTYMREALKEAKKAYKLGEIPIGAVVVFQDKIIARAHNLRQSRQDITAHAEMLAIQKACKKLKTWHLEGASLFVTMEPCVMCSGAIMQAHLDAIYYGAKNKRFGAHTGPFNLFDANYNHNVLLNSGILEEECSALVTNFFQELRTNKE